MQSPDEVGRMPSVPSLGPVWPYGSTPLVSTLPLSENQTGIDEKDAFAGLSVLLTDDGDAGGHARAVEEIGRQSDDAVRKGFWGRLRRIVNRA